MDRDDPVSDQIERWLNGDQPKTLGGLIDVFEEKSFAVIYLFLLGVPALPIPTGGATHVFEVIAMLLALELVAGRRRVWLPQRWLRLTVDGPRQTRFLHGLVRFIRFFERFSRPRLRRLFGHRVTNALFGVAILALSIGAFVAPPFSGLDTGPALGAVILSLGILLEDIALVVAGLVLGVGGVVVELVLGKAALHGIKQLISG